MKKILCSVIAVVMFACLAIPSLALDGGANAAADRNALCLAGGNDAVSGELMAGKPMPSRIEAPAADTKAAVSLNEALNVPGGSLDFYCYEMPEYGVYPWNVEEDWAVPGNTGIDGDPEIVGLTQAQVSVDIVCGENEGISFRFKVSCENADNTDYFAVFIDSYSPIAYWYGEEDWQTFTYPLSAGSHTITWVYNKDAQNYGGEDKAWLDDVEIIPMSGNQYVHSEELDAALNDGEGNLEFYTLAEAAYGEYPWTAEDGYAKSTNREVDNSLAIMYTEVTAEAGDVVSFMYKASSEEGIDILRFYVDGEQIVRWSGDTGWQGFTYELTEGVHELRWVYDKDINVSWLEDTAYIDDVRVGSPIAVQYVEITSEASAAAMRWVDLTWEVYPKTAFNKEVYFTSADESIATVNGNGRVFGISEGTTVITVHTVDGGYTADCTVTVTEADPPVDIYGFIYSQYADSDGYFSHIYQWARFTDVAPEEVELLGYMGEDYLPVVTCSVQIGNTVYGYTSDGQFFTVDAEALIYGGFVDAELWDCNVTGDDSFYPHEMAYDYSTGKAYIINYLYGLWEVDLETGDVLLDTGKLIHGDIPDLDDNAGLYIYGFAIDLEGNAYGMTAGAGLIWGGNGCSRFVSIDLETAEVTLIKQTDVESYQEQSMCFDYNTGRLYWAQFNTFYNQEPCDLYMVDTETGDLTWCGKITEYGAQLLGMFIPYFPEEPPVEPTEPPVEPTEPPVEPTEPPVEPTEPPVEPTEPPVEPTEPPVEPTEPPVEPTPTPAPVPGTGAAALTGLGVMALLSGAGVVLFRKKKD